MKQLKTGFKRTTELKRYRSEMFNQSKNNNSNYLIYPTFTKFNRLFVLSFENEEGRTSFSKYCWKKRFWCIDWWKTFFETPLKNKEEAYETVIEMGIYWTMNVFQSIIN